MTRFDFEKAEPWEVSTATLLPIGNHICTITSAEAGESSGGFPQLEVEVEGDKGTRKDWLVYGDRGGYGVQKIVALYRFSGTELSNDDQGEDGKLKPEAVARLVGKKVGVVVHEEDDRREPGKKRLRVKGYVDPSLIGNVTAQEPAAAVAGGISDDDIPF